MVIKANMATFNGEQTMLVGPKDACGAYIGFVVPESKLSSLRPLLEGQWSA
jgi:hypothetical protein